VSRLKRNIVANLSGRVFTAVLGLVFVPIIIRLMGIEAYGLVGFFASLQALFSLLDLGLSATINRELARLSAHRDGALEMRDLVRTLEVCYWGIAVLIAVAMLAISPFVGDWIHPEHLSRADVDQAALIMGLIMALQWPLSFYEGGLMGLQRQVAWNAISVSMACARQIGAVLLLWLVAPTVQVFLLWQVATSGLQTALTAWLVWRSLPESGRPTRFRRPVLQSVWRFAAGISATSVVSLGLGQMDKIVLSRMLSLEDFGYYSLAAVAAGGLQYLIGPIFSAAFPRFSELVAAGNQDTLRREYHRVAQFASVLVLAATVVLMGFAPQILQLWLGTPETVARTHRLVTVLAAGTAMNGLMHVPYALQLASGWTTLTMFTNAVALCLLVPATILLAREFGPIGAAWVWVALNAGYIVIQVPIMHRRLLVGEQWRWYGIDVAFPLAAAAACVGVCRLLVASDTSPVRIAGSLAAVSAATLFCAALATPATRELLQRSFDRWPGRLPSSGRTL
jgi:O-antigen/teichoic acid export membrane protein